MEIESKGVVINDRCSVLLAPSVLSQAHPAAVNLALKFLGFRSNGKFKK